MKGDSKRGAKTPTETAGSSVNTDRIRQEGKQKIIYSTRNITIITYTGWSREFSPITVDPFSKERGPQYQLPVILKSSSHSFLVMTWLTLSSGRPTRMLSNAWQRLVKCGPHSSLDQGIHWIPHFDGINRLPEMRDYWSKDEKLHYSPIASQISRSRFGAITRHLHFADNRKLPSRGEPGYNRLQKVQPIITAVKQRCASIYQPNVQNSIDEAMIPFKGMCIVSLR